MQSIEMIPFKWPFLPVMYELSKNNRQSQHQKQYDKRKTLTSSTNTRCSTQSHLQYYHPSCTLKSSSTLVGVGSQCCTTSGRHGYSDMKLYILWMPNVQAVDASGDAHYHVFWPFSDVGVDAEVRSLCMHWYLEASTGCTLCY